ncbi:efflux RND transporter periplasmic adaptor subunit [Litoribacillus peritrichatus]|uniref:Efflux RND transporter periplasmic adaptor subunit n=1 Tax=Litoribacillus peritrichatus TaxID=718191 RepID=A0ABP7MVD8_9GAMM
MRNNVKRTLFLFISMVLLVMVLIVLEEPPASPIQPEQTTPALPNISYTDVVPATHTTELTLYGELVPKWNVIIKAQVTGEVTEVSPRFEVDSLIDKGESLIQIEDSRYRSELSNAELNLAETRLLLRQAQEKTGLAKKDWQLSGFSRLPSDLALFKPQLDLAEKRVSSAESALNVAKRNLAYTRIVSPFNGVVAKRFVGLGQLVFEGDPVVQLLDYQHLQLSVSLNEAQWANLPEKWQQQTAFLYTPDDRFLGRAKMVYGGYRVDKDTRQYQLLMELNDVSDTTDGHSEIQAVPGLFVRVQVPGKPRRHWLRIPESALTREGLVWLIAADDTLHAYAPEHVQHSGHHVLVPPPEDEGLMVNGAWRIAITPLAFYVAGKQVKPIKRVEG